MELKPLGNTGVQVPEIGLGTWQYRGGVQPLREGVARGAFLIDTAEAYGTENVVGEAIENIRDDVFVATKVSPRNFRHDDVIKAADRSLKELGIERIDLYQLHWPNPDIPIDETMRAMDELVDAGKVRFIGVSNFSVKQLTEAQAAAKNKIVSNQVKYNLADREIERDLIPYCQENDVTIIAYSPLGHRLGTLKPQIGDALEDVAQDVGKTEAQVALNWSVYKDNVIAIPKSDSVGHTIENCESSGWRLSQEHINLLERVGQAAR